MKKQANKIANKIITIFALILLASFLFISLLGPTFFPVEEIVIKGNRRVSNNEIVKRSGIRTGLSNMFFLQSRSRKALLNSPWINDVAIIKEFPSKVLIEINESVPFCLYFDKNKEFYYLDENGKKLGTSNASVGLDFPIINSESFRQDLIKEAIEILKLSRSSNILNWNEISEIHVNHKYGIRILTTDKRNIDFGRGNIVSKWYKVERIINHSRKINLTEEYINISLENIGIVDFNTL